VAIQDIFEALRPELEDDCTVKFGTDALEEHDVAPKVTFVPGEFSFRATTRQGLASRDRHPRAVFSRRQAVEIHCWGENTADPRLSAQFAAAEELVERTLWAIERACRGSYELGAGSPLPNGATDAGVVLIFTVFFDIPVVEPVDRRELVAAQILDVSSTTDVPEAGVPAAMTGVAVFGTTDDETEVEATPAP